MSGTRTLNLGINVNANRTYTNPGAWSDVTKGFSGWYAPAGVTASYSADGYPAANGMQAICPMLGCPAGAYTLTWQGTATIAVKWAMLGPVTKSADGTSTATVTVAQPNNQILFTATGLSATDPLRNMHLYQPGMGAASPPFTPAFTKWLAPFTVLRGIDWAGVNVDKSTVNGPNVPLQWASRVQPTAWDQTTSGVAYEHFFALCKQANLTPWVNVPYLASDDFANQLAGLTETYGFSKVYIELSNEVWNQTFGQWVQNQNASVNYPASDPKVRMHQCYADRARRVGQIFKQVLGTAAQVVLAGQCVNPAVLSDGLTYIASKYGDVSASFDCLSVAAYFPAITPPVGQTMAQIAAACSAYIAGDMTTGLNGNAALSAKYGLPLIGYEGGQSLQSWNNPLGSPADLPTAIQSDASMGVLYQAWLGVCQAAGMSLVLHNSLIAPPSKSWIGSLQSNVMDAPGVKWQTISNFAALPLTVPTNPSTNPPPIQTPALPAMLVINGLTYKQVNQ